MSQNLTQKQTNKKKKTETFCNSGLFFRYCVLIDFDIQRNSTNLCGHAEKKT